MQHTYTYEVFKDFTAPLVALAGIAVTGTVAALGLRSFSKFKREKIEERRIEVALDALTLAYESKFVFQAIRARAIGSHEYEDGTDVSRSVPGGIVVKIKEGQQGAYAVIRRIEAREDFFERLRKIEPRFMAVFGAETDSIFEMVYNARTQLAGAAGQLFDIDRIEYDEQDRRIKEEKRELRELIFRGPNEDKKNDKIGDLTDGFRTRIEAICRPIVDHQYGKTKSPG
ncbi:hypothetical protein IVB38_06855 [Bradyrhizobium sp. 38]|uniref:hypothetical protein n=1 Tax=unclassified Bradyrhizobium TaxID=2631580 RepID=UPI001FFBBAF4|nr:MULTISPECIES: hypothetical protein [unclassified Bradyrhizobium]MCK1335759.1 hypothetical protein [Bradyrhizobium sp. 38]MCK1776947.1 hypothetical protein [Bradyrhizobium sp. 132]UPJ59728.1 hypothetical protein IVB24_08030 [Bradyrhizobium sp. 192]